MTGNKLPRGYEQRDSGLKKRQGYTVECVPVWCVCSVVSDFLWPHGMYPTRLLCSWTFPSKTTGVGYHIQHYAVFG